jgi:MFS family permease
MHHILGGGISLGCMMLLLSAAPSVYFAAPVIFLTGAASILYMTSTTAIVQVEAKPEMHGRILALQTAIVGGSSALGGPIVGGLADFCGARSPLVLGGVVCLVTAAFGALAALRQGILGHQTSKNI